MSMFGLRHVAERAGRVAGNRLARFLAPRAANAYPFLGIIFRTIPLLVMASSAASCVTNACEEAPNGRPDGPEAYEAAPAAVATLSDDERERFYQMLDSLPIDGPVPSHVDPSVTDVCADLTIPDVQDEWALLTEAVGSRPAVDIVQFALSEFTSLQADSDLARTSELVTDFPEDGAGEHMGSRRASVCANLVPSSRWTRSQGAPPDIQ